MKFTSFDQHCLGGEGGGEGVKGWRRKLMWRDSVVAASSCHEVLYVLVWNFFMIFFATSYISTTSAAGESGKKDLRKFPGRFLFSFYSFLDFTELLGMKRIVIT